MKYVDIVFDGPPSYESGRFIEAENEHGASVSVGEWIHREDGFWVLRIKNNFGAKKPLPEKALWFRIADPNYADQFRKQIAKNAIHYFRDELPELAVEGLIEKGTVRIYRELILAWLNKEFGKCEEE